MINTFWNWIVSTVTNAVNTLNSLYNNSTLHPFFELLLVIVGIGVILKFILFPLLGISYMGASDKVDKSIKKGVKSLDMKSDDYWK